MNSARMFSYLCQIGVILSKQGFDRSKPDHFIIVINCKYSETV